MLLELLFSNFAKAQKLPPSKIYFIQPEFLIGKNISNYDEFPQSNMRSSVVMSLGAIHLDTGKHWVSYYNYPTTGVSVEFSHLGNPRIFGNEYSIIPFILLRTSLNPRRSWDFKLGLGASYFERPYDETNNPSNLVIGSNYNWAFQLYCYKNLAVTEAFIMKMGIGYSHNSNAHTQLPNYGLNAAMLGLAIQFPTRRYNPFYAMEQGRKPIDREKHYFLNLRSGLGWHELGGTVEPIGGKDWLIFSQSIAGGIIFKQQLKIRLGLTYRFYQSFYDYVKTYHVRGLGQNPRSEASNINLFIGVEFLMGHIGLDIEGGINLHKPFYEEYNLRWEYKEGFEYFRNRYFTSLLGIKYYLISNEKMPKHNVSLGTQINANFGEADFMDFSLEYTFLIK